MKTLLVTRKMIVSIFTVILLVYGLQGISYGQGVLTITPGETNTSLAVDFQIRLDDGVDENAYQIQLRPKTIQGDWITKCVVVKHGTGVIDAGDPDVYSSRVHAGYTCFLFICIGGGYSDKTFDIKAIFTDLDPGTTYAARWRDTNMQTCDQNPPNPDPWSEIGEGTTRLVAPPRVEFVDINLAKKVRISLGLDYVGVHIELLKIPEASLEKLTKLEADERKITDLTGLEQATELTELNLANNQISDITPLSQLTKLTNLNLSSNQITDVTPLVHLTQLTTLHLLNNLIEDTSPLLQLLHANPQMDIYIDKPMVITEPGDSTSLYFINGKSIQHVNYDGTHTPNIVIGLRLPRGIALDVAEEKIYWTNAGFFTNEIERSNFDGSNVETIKHRYELDYPKDIAIDAERGKIYWTNVGFWANDVDIQRSNLDGTNMENIIVNLSTPGGIAIDSANSKIYWTSYRYIRRSNLDGTNIEKIVSSDTDNNGIALDVLGGKIYWVNGKDKKIQNVNLNGTNIQDIVTGLNEPEGIALDLKNDKIYWSDGSVIQRSNLDGTNIEKVVIGLADLRSFVLNTSQRLTPTSTPTDAVVSISPASVVSPAVGEQITFNLNIAGGEAVAGYQATVLFDTTALRYVSSANGDYLPAGAFFVDPKVERNLIKLNAVSLAGESNGDGTLATLTFEVIAVKESALTLSDVLLTNSAGAAFVPMVENAEITEAPQLKGDVNGDGIVNIQDLVLVASNIGKTGQNATDVNGDGIVNIQDLVLVASALGSSAAAPSVLSQSLETLTAADVRRWLSQAQQLDFTDATSLQGLLFLQQLLEALTPKETTLLANYPNPFNPETWIPYHLTKDANVTLHIYAVNGTLVRTLALGHQAAGIYQNRSRAAYWDGKNESGESVASGLYYYTLTADNFTATRKMLIRK